jgi:hypothetical protein
MWLRSLVPIGGQLLICGHSKPFRMSRYPAVNYLQRRDASVNLSPRRERLPDRVYLRLFARVKKCLADRFGFLSVDPVRS